ncbi:MAG: DUF5666 domain-containing protein [Woeseia sp.]
MKARSSRQKFFSKCTAVLSIAAIVAACGGGGYSGTQDPIAGIDAGGAPTRFIAIGPISGFGSIIVNGVRYDTSQAQIFVDGAAGTEADLTVGQIVAVSGSISGNSRTADRVEFDENVEGPIESIDLANNSMVVLGQTVIVTAATSFDDGISPDSLQGLVPGDVVEISGNLDSNGNILASRIQRKAPGGLFEVTGIVSSHNGASATFMINDLLVDYGSAVLLDFGSGQPADGDLVEAEGSQLGASGELIASKVEFKGNDFDDRIDNDTEIEIEGLITRFVSSTDFDVADFAVTTNSQTEYGGGTVADLGLNVRIEVHGRRDSQGRILAREIEFEDVGDIEIHAIVDSVDAANSRLIMLSIVVELSSDTRMEDKAGSNPLRSFSISDINPGDWLEIRGTESATGGVAATRAERDDPRSESRIRGFATNVIDPSFQILGLDIDTDASTQFRNITRADFFATADGRLVQADGSLNGGRFLATEVEFEPVN